MPIYSFFSKALLVSTVVLQATAVPLNSAKPAVASNAGSALLAAASSHPAVSSIVRAAATSSPTSGTSYPSGTATPAAGARKIQYGGVNIAGFEFGCSHDGTCKKGSAVTTMAQGGGLTQMRHFVSKGMNVFRLPVSWQYLTGYGAPNKLDTTNFGVYNQLVQACLDSGAALCIIDLHNYARWNGQIVGQGGPSNKIFAQFWTSLATRYAGNSKVAFDIMNEPYDLDISLWADTTQNVVNAIRGIGANNIIFISGTDFASAGSFATSGNGDKMLQIRNPSGDYNNLVISVHQYLDPDFGGKSAECTQGTEAVSNFKNLASHLRSNGRKAMVLEIGAGNNQACSTQFCAMLDVINSNADVYMGVTTWAAGAFEASYALSETPSGSGSSLADTLLVKNCVIPKLGSS